MPQSIIKLIDVLTKHAVTIVLAVLLIITGSLGYSAYKDSQKAKSQVVSLQGQVEDYKQISDKLAKLETDYVSQQELYAAAKKEWKRELSDLQGQLKSVADSSFTIKSFPLTQDKPDLVDSTGITQEVQFVDSSGKLGPVVGVVHIDKDSGRTTSKVLDHEFRVELLTTKDKDGREHVYAKGFYIQTEPSLDGKIGKPDWQGKLFPLDITSGSIVVGPETIHPNVLVRKFQFAPHLNVGPYLGVSQLAGLQYGVHGDVSFFGYGLTKMDMDYHLLGIGINGNKNYIDMNLTPVSYRVGNRLPLVHNVYLGPSVGIGTGGTSVSLTINAQL